MSNAERRELAVTAEAVARRSYGKLVAILAARTPATSSSEALRTDGETWCET
jgi:hypothetical protein